MERLIGGDSPGQDTVNATILLTRSRGIISKLIRWQTRALWSHAAVMLGGTVYEAREWRGVQSMPSKDWRHGDITQTFVVKVTDEQFAAMHGFLEEQVGKRYDYGSVLRFLSRRQESRRGSGKWFCSELVFAAFAKAGIRLLARVEPWAVSPGLLSMSPLITE